MSDNNRRAFFNGEMVAVIWLLFVAMAGFVWVYSLFFAPYGWWIEHPMLFCLYVIGVIGAFLAWAFRIVDLRSITD